MASKKINLDEMEVSYVQANDLRKGGYALLRKQFVCKLMELSKSKPGKHGSAKIKVIGLDIFTGKKYDDIFGSSEQVCVPTVTKQDYQLLYILDDNYVKLQTAAGGETREDLKLPEDSELTEQIEKAFWDDNSLIITTIKALDREQICGFKINTKLNEAA